MSKSYKRARVENHVEEDSSTSRCFIQPDSISKHLYCSICQDIFSSPYRAPCGHSYCRKCIWMWLEHNKSCPEDRLPLRMEQLHHDFIVENIIGDQMVACTYRRVGCQKVMALNTMQSHTRQCVFNPANQPRFVREHLKSELPGISLSPTRGASTSTMGSPSPTLDSPLQSSLFMRLYTSDAKDRLAAMFEKKK